MVWHIFRKDLRLSWKFALIAAMLQWLATGLVKVGTLSTNPKIAELHSLTREAGTLAVFLAIVIAVQRDAVPGAAQDWLMRPIRRRDMLLAKFLFFVVAIQLPIFAGCTAEGIAFGLGFWDALFGALWQSAMVTIGIGVPALAISALTGSAVEAAVLAMLSVVVAAASTQMGTWGTWIENGVSGTAWIGDVSLMVGMFLAGTIALGIQYRRRSTTRARVAWGVFVMGAAGSLLPLKAALVFEQRIAPAPGAGQGVQLVFDPAAKPYQVFPGEVASRLAPIYLPIRAEGVGPDMAIVADHAEVRVTGAHGAIQTLPRTRTPIFGSGPGYQSLENGEFAPSLREESVHVHGDYWLTLVKETGRYSMPEANGDALIPALGKCRTRWATFGMADFGCVKAGPFAGCFEIGSDQMRDRATFRCQSYAPSFVWLPNWDEIVTTQARFVLTDGGDGKVTVRTYQAINHFERSLDIPSVRLRDWEGVAAK